MLSKVPLNNTWDSETALVVGQHVTEVRSDSFTNDVECFSWKLHDGEGKGFAVAWTGSRSHCIFLAVQLGTSYRSSEAPSFLVCKTAMRKSHTVALGLNETNGNCLILSIHIPVPILFYGKDSEET